MGEKEDYNEVIDGMMRQLLSKELMFDPMKSVTLKFPEWLAKNKSQLSEEDYDRYGHQYQFFQRIVAVYETEPVSILNVKSNRGICCSAVIAADVYSSTLAWHACIGC